MSLNLTEGACCGEVELMKRILPDGMTTIRIPLSSPSYLYLLWDDDEHDDGGGFEDEIRLGGSEESDMVGLLDR